METVRHFIIDIDSTQTVRVVQSGLLFAAGEGVPVTLLADAARIPDYGRDLKRPVAIRDRLKRIGYFCETRFDAVHGRRYAMIAFRNPKERRLAMAAMDGITNLRQHHIDAGCDAEDLDRLIAREKLAMAAHGTNR